MLKKSWGRIGLRTSIQDQVGVAQNVWDHFGVAERKGMGTAARRCQGHKGGRTRLASSARLQRAVPHCQQPVRARDLASQVLDFSTLEDSPYEAEGATSMGAWRLLMISSAGGLNSARLSAAGCDESSLSCGRYSLKSIALFPCCPWISECSQRGEVCHSLHVSVTFLSFSLQCR